MRWLPAIIWAGLILWGTSSPQGALPVSAQDIDVVPLFSLLHIGAYAGLTFLLAWPLGRTRSPWRSVAIAALIAVAFGTVDEWHQRFVPGRSPEMLDWWSNLIGAAIGTVLYVGLVTMWQSRRASTYS